MSKNSLYSVTSPSAPAPPAPVSFNINDNNMDYSYNNNNNNNIDWDEFKNSEQYFGNSREGTIDCNYYGTSHKKLFVRDGKDVKLMDVKGKKSRKKMKKEQKYNRETIMGIANDTSIKFVDNDQSSVKSNTKPELKSNNNENDAPKKRKRPRRRKKHKKQKNRNEEHSVSSHNNNDYSNYNSNNNNNNVNNNNNYNNNNINENDGNNIENAPSNNDIESISVMNSNDNNNNDNNNNNNNNDCNINDSEIKSDINNNISGNNIENKEELLSPKMDDAIIAVINSDINNSKPKPITCDYKAMSKFTHQQKTRQRNVFQNDIEKLIQQTEWTRNNLFFHHSGLHMCIKGGRDNIIANLFIRCPNLLGHNGGGNIDDNGALNLGVYNNFLELINNEISIVLNNSIHFPYDDYDENINTLSKLGHDGLRKYYMILTYQYKIGMYIYVYIHLYLYLYVYLYYIILYFIMIYI